MLVIVIAEVFGEGCFELLGKFLEAHLVLHIQVLKDADQAIHGLACWLLIAEGPAKLEAGVEIDEEAVDVASIADIRHPHKIFAFKHDLLFAGFVRDTSMRNS